MQNTNSMEDSLEEQMRYARAMRRVRSIKGFYIHLFAYIVINGFILISSWVQMEPGTDYFSFNIFGTPIIWGIGLFFHFLGVFGTNIFLGNNWEERKIKEMMGKDDREQQRWE